MRIATEKIKILCEQKSISVQRLLRTAGVSRNAYYSLARRNSILPDSIVAIARRLRVRPGDLLTEDTPGLEKARTLLAKAVTIAHAHKSADPDNIRHTLLLLKKEPVDRLRSALIRAQKFDIR